MAEITYRIPSRTVQYGFVEVRRSWSDDEPTDPEMLAAAYVSYVYAFQKEEEATVQRLKDAPSGALKAPLAASEFKPDRPVDPVDKAAQIVAEGLGGATEVDSTEEISDDGQNSDEMPGGIAPWEQDLARKSKPWEAEATAPKAVVTEDW